MIAIVFPEIFILLEFEIYIKTIHSVYSILLFIFLCIKCLRFDYVDECTTIFIIPLLIAFGLFMGFCYDKIHTFN